MLRRSLLLAVVVGASLLSAGAALAQDPPDVRAAIHAEGVSKIGGCQDLGEEVAALATPRPAAGTWVGVRGLGVVLTSTTENVVAGPVLLAAPHFIVVFAGGEPVACGEIGGYLADGAEADLAIALQPVGDPASLSGFFGFVGFFGVATLADLDGEVEIELAIAQPACYADPLIGC